MESKEHLTTSALKPPENMPDTIGTSATKNTKITILKAIFSLGLLTLLLVNLDRQTFIDLSRSVSPWFFIPLGAMFIAAQFLGGWRWKAVLACHGFYQSISRGMYLYLVGYFYNNFLPTAIGGDLVRGYEAGKAFRNFSKVYGSIILERILGLLATLTLALLFLPVVMPPRILALLVLGLNIVAWSGWFLLLSKKSGLVLSYISSRIPFKIKTKANQILEIIIEYQDNLRSIRKCFCLSLLYQFSLVFVAWCGARLAGVNELSLASFMLIVPLIWVVSLIPVSLNALGVREVSFAYFFSLFGVAPEKGVLTSLVLFGTILTAGIVGGILWGTSGKWDNKSSP